MIRGLSSKHSEFEYPHSRAFSGSISILLHTGCKSREGRPGRFHVVWWRQVDRGVDAQGAVLDNCKLCIDQPQDYWTMSCIDAVLNVSLKFLDEIAQESLKILCQAPPPICPPIIASHTYNYTIIMFGRTWVAKRLELCKNFMMCRSQLVNYNYVVSN